MADVHEEIAVPAGDQLVDEVNVSGSVQFVNCVNKSNQIHDLFVCDYQPSVESADQRDSPGSKPGDVELDEPSQDADEVSGLVTSCNPEPNSSPLIRPLFQIPEEPDNCGPPGPNHGGVQSDQPREDGAEVSRSFPHCNQRLTVIGSFNF
jgi:hypothetical protein